MAETLLKEYIRKAEESDLIPQNAIKVESAGLFVVEDTANKGYQCYGGRVWYKYRDA